MQNQSKTILQEDQEEIISLDTVKEFLNIFNNSHNDLLSKLIKSARKTVESILNMPLNNDIIEYKTNNFNKIPHHTSVELPDTPIHKVISVQYKKQEINDFCLLNSGLKSSIQIPFLNIPIDENLTIKYVRGPKKEEINESIKLAIMMLVKEMFTERSTKTSSIQNIKELLTPFINFNL